MDRGRGGNRSIRETIAGWVVGDERQMTIRRCLASVAFNRDFHAAEAMDEVGAHAFDCARHMHSHPPFVHFFKQHAQLQFGQSRADAAVDTVAE